MTIPAGPSVAFVQMFENTLEMLSQQMDERLRPHVDVDNNFVGEAKFYPQYGTDTFTQIMTRYADTPLSLANLFQRCVFPSFFVSATLEDPQDALATLVDVKSGFYEAKMYAAARKFDALIIAAATAASTTGSPISGTTTTALPAAQQLADTFGNGATPTGMTKAKMLRAKRLMDAAEVRQYDRVMVLQAGQLEDLLNSTEATSRDFNTVEALVDGRLTKWCGFDLVHSEQLTQSGSDTLNIAFQKKGMKLAIQKNPEGRIDPRIDKNYAWQVYMSISCGATRMEEVSVVQAASLNQ
jgi:hypothetical protein